MYFKRSHSCPWPYSNVVSVIRSKYAHGAFSVVKCYPIVIRSLKMHFNARCKKGQKCNQMWWQWVMEKEPRKCQVTLIHTTCATYCITHFSQYNIKNTLKNIHLLNSSPLPNEWRPLPKKEPVWWTGVHRQWSRRF